MVAEGARQVTDFRPFPSPAFSEAAAAREARPVKLRDGSWGVRVTVGPGETIGAGEELTVQPRTGKPWRAVVTEVVATFDGAALVRTRKAGADAPPDDPREALTAALGALAEATRAVRAARNALARPQEHSTPRAG